MCWQTVEQQFNPALAIASSVHKQKIAVNDEKTYNREVSAFDKIKDNYPKFLMTLDFDNTSINGIQKTNVIDWLLE